MDPERFQQLALEHLDAVYRMALQLTRHPDEASDLVQETYLNALRFGGERYEERGAGMRAWLFKILHNAFYTRIGRDKKAPRATEHLQAVSEEPPPDDPGFAWDLEHLDWEHVDERIKAAIEQLRPEYRSVLLLWGVEGMKYREIADVQEIPIGTVMSRLHRARGLLMEQLQDLAEERRIAPR